MSLCFFCVFFVAFVCNCHFAFVCLFVLMIPEECAGAVAMHLGTLNLE